MLVVALTLSACLPWAEYEANAKLDAGATHGGSADSGPGAPDGGTRDAGAVDAGATDAGTRDAGAFDAGFAGSPWSRINGNFSTSRQTVTALAVTPRGDVAITGGFTGDGVFGGTSVWNAQYFDVYTAVYGPDGTARASHVAGADNAEGKAVAFDSRGNVLSLVRLLPRGTATATAAFSPTAQVSAENSTDVAALVKYSADGGGLEWMHYAKAGLSTVWPLFEATALAVSPTNDSAVVAAKMRSNWALDANPTSNGTYGEWVFLSYSSNGALLWSQQTNCGNAQDDTMHGPEALAFDDDGTLYLLGELGSRACSFPPLGSVAGPSSLTLAKVSASGAFSRINRYPGFDPGAESSGALAARSGHLWLAQTFQGTLTLASATYAAAGGTDVLVTRVRTSDLGPDPGSELVIGGTGDERVRGLQIAPDGSLWLAAETSGGLTLGGATVSADGGAGLFLVHLSAPAAGRADVLQVRQLSTLRGSSVRALGIDGSGAPHVAGETVSGVDLGSGALKASSDAGVYLGRLGP